MHTRRTLAAALSATLLASLASATPSAAITNTESPADISVSAAPRSDAEVKAAATRMHAGGVKAFQSPRPQTPLTARYAQHTVLVRLASTATAADQARILAKVKGRLAGTLPNGYLKVTTTGTAADATKVLSGDPAVATASLDGVRYLTATPNDPAYTYGDQNYLKTIRLPQAWDLQKSATGVVIAVVDTGVEASHPDLVGKVVTGYSVVGGSPTTDTRGHGTIVAGIAAANTNNGEGVAGAAWNGRIMPIKVFAGETANDSDIAAGITWAADHGAKIINLSLGGPGDAQILHDAITYAVSKNVLVIAAAGNTGDDVPQYPAAYPEVISVGATDASGKLVDFSSVGSGVDIAAPGLDITSTYPRQSGCYPCYAFGAAGTSFSAPLVAGVAALVKAKNPSFTPGQIRARLMDTARDAGPRGLDPYYGAGILDAYAALGGAKAAALPMRSGDAYEPNDVPARATSLSSGKSATVMPEGDIDWYRYDLTSSATLTVILDRAMFDPNRFTNAELVVALYDSQLRLLQETSPTPSDLGLTKSVKKGTYYVRVRSANGALDDRPYSIWVNTGAPDLYVGEPFTNGVSLYAGQSFDKGVTAIADVTGDGLPDAILLNGFYFDAKYDYKLVVFPQNTDGSLGAGVPYDTRGGDELAAIAVLDANGDGRLDVAIAEAAGVEVLTQTATGTLNAGVLLPDMTRPYGIAAADMDGDGDQDLVVFTGTSLVLYTQAPAGTFTPSVIATRPYAYTVISEVEIGDLNGDGRPDVASIDIDGAAVTLRNPDGTWADTEHYVAFPGYGVKAIEVADVTGDARADLLATSGSPSGDVVALWKQQPDGSLSTSQTLSVISQADAIEAADWNNDGRLDLFVAHTDQGFVSMFKQLADGSFDDEILTHASVFYREGPQAMALSDLNHDGYIDLATAGMHNGLWVAYNSKAFNGPALGPQQCVKKVSVADFGLLPAPWTSVSVTAPTALNPVTVNGQTIKLLDGTSGSAYPVKVAYNPANHTITLTRPFSASTSTKLLPLAVSGRAYRLVVDGLTDTGGNPCTGYTMTFTR